MISRPRLRSHYQVVDTTDATFLLAETGEYVFEAPLTRRLLPMLDGTRTLAQLSDQVGQANPMSVFGAIASLERAGHLADGPAPDDTDATWSDAMQLPTSPATPGALIQVVALDGINPDPAVRAIGPGARPVDPAAVAQTPTSFVVVLTEDYLSPAVAVLAGRLHELAVPWMLAKPTGRVVWTGPVFQPDQTGCWTCMQQRMSANQQVRRFVESRTGEALAVPSHGDNPAAAALAAGLVAASVAQFAATGSCALDGVLSTTDLADHAQTRNQLVRQPQCRTCGDPSRTTADVKILLSQDRTGTVDDSGYRRGSVGETLARLDKHVSPLLGAVTNVLALDDANEEGICYTSAAFHNFPMVQDSVATLKRNMRAMSGGKGRTPELSRVSALCEALERYAGIWRGDEPVQRSSYDDLDPDLAVHPERLTLFSDSQYAGREAWNADPLHRLHLVPERFDPTRRIDWSLTWSLTQNCERLLPSAFSWYGHPDLKQHFYCIGDSNGCAGGNDLDEAILHGMTEVIERDAIALWWYNRVARPAFDLASLDNEYVDRLREFYRSQDRSVWALDVTADIGVPTIVAVSARNHSVEDIMVGFGSHPDPKVAAMRALAELNQFLPFVRRRDHAGNTVYLGNDPEMTNWARTATLADNPWLVPNDAPARSVADYGWDPTAGLPGALRRCQSELEGAGLEVIVANQTRPDIELAVVKVIVPGARHFWRRVGPGRLYDVPVRLGWLSSPTPEADLNPRNVFF